MIAWYWLIPAFFAGGIVLCLPILWLIGTQVGDDKEE